MMTAIVPVLEDWMDVVAYNIRGACAVMGIGRSTCYRLIADKRLDALKVRGRTVVSAASITRYFATAPQANINSKK